MRHGQAAVSPALTSQGNGRFVAFILRLAWAATVRFPPFAQSSGASDVLGPERAYTRKAGASL